MKLLATGVLVLSLCVACATGGTSERNAQQTSGGEMYVQLCASCHGAAGRGDGPVALLIKTGVPDLTRIAVRNGGVFPAADVARTIDGRWDRRAHGTRDMPVWGRRLYYSAKPEDSAERARVDARIDELVSHLRSIQVE